MARPSRYEFLSFCVRASLGVLALITELRCRCYSGVICIDTSIYEQISRSPRVLLCHRIKGRLQERDNVSSDQTGRRVGIDPRVIIDRDVAAEAPFDI